MRATSTLVLAALALPGVAEAAGPCPVIGALLAENPKRMKGLGVTVDGAGMIDVTLNGAADAVRGAENCDVYGPARELQINCDWDFEVEAEARRGLEVVMGRLEACLPAPLERKKPVVYTEQQLAEAAARSGASYADYLRNREVLADYEGSYPLGHGEDQSLDVSVTLVRDRETGSLHMDANLERD